PRNWARHLLRAREQQRSSGGFTEFVPLPFVHMEAPMWLRGQARSGPTFGETLLVHAIARLALHPWITNIQVSWVKLGAQRFAPADQLGAAVRHEHGGRTRHAVVVRRHREGVGPRGRNCEQVVASRLRQIDAVYEHVSGFAVLARNAIDP